jgi:hypothetical protein
MSLGEFTKAARELSRNPLGVIALFIVLIYALASIVVIQGSSLTVYQRDIFVWFLVTYPVLVLITFAWLVSRHPAKLYAPRDFQDQSHWVELQQVRAAIVAANDASGNTSAGAASGSSVTIKDEPPRSRPATRGKAKRTKSS